MGRTVNGILRLACGVGLVGALLAGNVAASEPTPVGLWRAYGDDGKEPEALIEIVHRNGVYEGRIAKLFPRPGIPTDSRCELCPGNRKGLPIQGLTILTGMRKEGAGFGGGEILDPESGEVYRAIMTLSPDNRRLSVRGYVGISLFGRSQTWVRE